MFDHVTIRAFGLSTVPVVEREQGRLAGRKLSDDAVPGPVPAEVDVSLHDMDRARHKTCPDQT